MPRNGYTFYFFVTMVIRPNDTVWTSECRKLHVLNPCYSDKLLVSSEIYEDNNLINVESYCKREYVFINKKDAFLRMSLIKERFSSYALNVYSNLSYAIQQNREKYTLCVQ